MYPLAMNTPPSPPETNVTFGPSIAGPHRQFTGHTSFSAGLHDSASVAGPHSADTPVSRLRRQPSIFYNSPGHRSESRERNPSISSKLLVVVVPPVAIVQEHGTLGNTAGPSHRLSQGIIMPLSPNMSGQLIAIAKEFNFPSVAGLCLYYCYHEADVTMTPRLSEEIWTTIWGLTDVSSQVRERRPPIVGRLEFDIDMGKARWYTAWLSSRQRESMDYPFYHGAATAPSQHYRTDSRFTFPQTVATDDFSEHQPIQQHSAPLMRHVPRKLSLVERFDANSALPIPGHQGHDSQTAILAPMSSHVLSPIKQQEEPKSARAELDNKVNTWRATAIASPGPFDEAVPSSFLPASNPDPSSPSDEPLRLEDYAWSISSLGPDDDASFVYGTDFYPPSIHLCDRVNGSVASTASYCTSSGPSDYPIYFSMSASSRLPSPDLGYRMLDDSPPTPFTATSWGPPSQYAFSLSSDDYQPSIDIGHRGYYSRPLTPLTATSWGPQSDDGWVPESPQSAFSVHLGDRGEFSRPVTPQTATSWGPPTGPLSPLSPYRLPTPDIAHRGFEDVTAMVLQRWPGRPWRHAWPYNRQTQSSSTRSSGWVPIISKVIKQGKGRKSSSAPRSEGSSHYPHFDLYPPVQRQQRVEPITAGYPDFVLYPAPEQSNVSTPEVVKDKHGYPYNLERIYEPRSSKPTKTVNGRSESDLTKMVLERWTGQPWRHVWPYIRKVEPRPQQSRWTPIISKVVEQNEVAKKQRLTGAVSRGFYGHFDLYPPVESQGPVGYPFNLDRIYPVSESRSQPSRVNSQSQYPYFEIYPAVYPFNLNQIYPSHGGANRPNKLVLQPIHVTKSQYPCFELYPAVYPFNLERIYTPVVTISQTPRNPSPVAVDVEGKSQYPFFEIYPAVYPFNLECIYPRPNGATTERVSTKVTSQAVSPFGYPFIEIYRPVYPYNLDAIYPSLTLPSRQRRDAPESTAQNGIVKAGYPYIVIYPTVYPFFDLYPSVAGALVSVSKTPTDLVICSSPTGYPYFNLYPAVYPHFDLYPSLAGSQLGNDHPLPRKVIVETTSYSYPYFELYPSVYPHFSLWPSLEPSIQPLITLGPPSEPQPQVSQEKFRETRHRLTHAELHARVMMEKGLGHGKLWLEDALEAFPPVPILPSTLSRSASLSIPSVRVSLAPRMPKSAGASPSTIPESLTRSASVSSRSNRTSTLAQRRSLWENATPASSRPTSIKAEPRRLHGRRDSLVLQRIKALNSNHSSVHYDT